MSASAVNIIVGAVIALVALGFVVWPLIRGRPAAAPTETSKLDLAEQEILRYRARARACATCGPRPEADAVYCSSCGRPVTIVPESPRA